MQKIILSGCCGHMGRVVADICAGDPEVEVSAGIDLLAQPMEGFPVFSSPAACAAPGDVLIDFSHPAALEGLLEFCAQRKLPAVLATTGYSEEQLAKIEAASGAVPIFRSANMSIGINVLLELVRQAAALLGDGFDVEITERHHRRKLDAPSGTALMLADAAASALPYEPEYVYDRYSVRKPRDSREIGISSLRGGHHCGGPLRGIRGPGRGDRVQPPRRQPGGVRRGRGAGSQVPGGRGHAGYVRYVRPHRPLAGASNPVFTALKCRLAGSFPARRHFWL